MYGNAGSPMLCVEYGVPQGRRLGPILFIMFINDIRRRSCATRLVIYADDTSVFPSDNNLCSLAERTGNILSHHKTWLTVNRHTLGIHTVECVDSINFLGFHFNET